MVLMWENKLKRLNHWDRVLGPTFMMMQKLQKSVQEWLKCNSLPITLQSRLWASKLGWAWIWKFRLNLRPNSVSHEKKYIKYNPLWCQYGIKVAVVGLKKRHPIISRCLLDTWHAQHSPHPHNSPSPTSAIRSTLRLNNCELEGRGIKNIFIQCSWKTKKKVVWIDLSFLSKNLPFRLL